jgi:hypothetical protein
LLHPLVGDEIARIDKMKRLIVIGDAYSEFDDYTDNGMILTSAGFTNPPPSFFVEVLTRKKLFFPAGCLMNVKNFREEETAISSPFNVGTNSIQIQLKRAGLILPSEEQRICLSSGEHFYNPLSLGLDERVPWCGTMETTFYNRKDVPPENVGPKKHQQNLLKKTRPQSNVPSGPYGIVTIKESTFVLTDADAVSNYYLQTYPENNQIIHWMIDFLREK